MERATDRHSAQARDAQMPGPSMRAGSRGLRRNERIRAARISRDIRALLAVGVVVVAGALSAACAPALAFSQRGHVLSKLRQFGEVGTALGQFAEKAGPAGVAVGEATGDVYVVDPGNFRVEQFGPPPHATEPKSAEPNKAIRTWGWGVTDGKPEFEICTTTCQKGIAGTGEG